MNLLSIQGHFAPAFRLNKEDAVELQEKVKVITQERVVVISSKFRTDLVFYEGDDKMEQITRIWCDIAGVIYKDHIKTRLFRSSTELITLTHFFYRLQLLSRMPQWYKMYYEQLLSTWMENPKDQILDTLIKVMTQLNELFNEHSLKLDEYEFRQIVGRFLNLREMASMNEKSSN